MTTTPTPAQDRRQQLRDVLIRRRRAELAGGVVAVGRGVLLPLSWQQLGLWFLYQWDPGSSTYHLPLVLRLRGRLDRVALAAALRAVLVRHEGLRTRFVVSDGQPWQLIDPPPAELVLPVTELPADGWQDVVAAEVRRPFRLLEEPGFRWSLARLGAQEHVLLLNSHHIITDGWSLGILTADLSAAYRHAVTARHATADPDSGVDPLLGLAPLAIQPADYAAWQHQHRDKLDTGLAYWSSQLAELPTLALPTDRPRPAAPSGAGGGLSTGIPPATAAGITALAGRLKVSPLAVLLAGFSTVLHHYTAQTDLPVGSIFSGRTRTELEPLIGYLANTVVLRTHLHPQHSATDHIQHCHNTILHAMQHQDTPFTQLVNTLQPPRIPGQNPLFQTALSLLPAQVTGGQLQLADVTVTRVPLETKVSRFDLLVQVAPRADGSMVVAAEYASDLFDPGRIERLLAHFTTALAQLVADPSRRLDELLVLTEAERSLVAGPFSSGTAPATGTGTAPALGTGMARPAATGSTTLQTVISILTDLLTPANPLQPHHNFFTEGGSSLVLARLTAAIEDSCGVQLTVRDLYLAPTPAEMAAVIDERATDRSAVPGVARSALQPLRIGGGRPPIFLVHAVGGSAVPYLPLVELLDPAQPVYAFEAPGLHGRPDRPVRPGGTIVSIAAEYLGELRRVQPHGPYRLAGWSVGGMIAQQLAVDLRSAGEDVALLALLDAVPGEAGTQVPDRAGLLSWFAHDLVSIRGRELPDLAAASLRSVPEAEQLPRVLAHLVAHGVIEDGDRNAVATRFEVFSELATAFLHHRPVPLDCPTELLVAADTAIDPVPRWRAVGGPLNVHPVAGNHYTMLQPPRLTSVAAVLNRLLDRSLPPAAELGSSPAPLTAPDSR
jgi:thioesterase domain-containing protein/non-ribosomal peptide synthetase component F